MKKLIFTVTKKDLKITHFSAGGPGGQHRDHGNSATRIVHPASGAVGVASDNRSQLQNSRSALKKLTETLEFRLWLARKTLDGPTPEERVEADMQPENLLIEGRETGTWAKIQ